MRQSGRWSYMEGCSMGFRSLKSISLHRLLVAVIPFVPLCAWCLLLSGSGWNRTEFCFISSPSALPHPYVRRETSHQHHFIPFCSCFQEVAETYSHWDTVCREVGSILWPKWGIFHILGYMPSDKSPLKGLMSTALSWRLAQMIFQPKSIYSL